MKYINLLIKPASSMCQLRCRYCFYEDEAAKRAHFSMGMMSRETARLLVDRAYAEISPGGYVSFAFQGGEPMLAGLEFFRDFVGYANEKCPPRVQTGFSIQTNGIAIDDDWAEFFRENGFLVGISLDGYDELHDLHRTDAAGKGTWSAARRALDVLQRHEVMHNALCVVTAQCARNPKRVYESLKKLGVQYMQFIACLDPIGVKRGSLKHSLTPEAYGKFLMRLFDLWFDDWQKGRYRSIRLFDDYINMMTGRGAGACAACGQCGSYFVVEGDGSVYPCDFYVLDKWRMGSIHETSLTGLAASEAAVEFLKWGTDKPSECAPCRFRAICNGGCKNDWYYDEAGAPHNYYCGAFRTLFEYAAPRLNMIARAEMMANR